MVIFITRTNFWVHTEGSWDHHHLPIRGSQICISCAQVKTFDMTWLKRFKFPLSFFMDTKTPMVQPGLVVSCDRQTTVFVVLYIFFYFTIFLFVFVRILFVIFCPQKISFLYVSSFCITKTKYLKWIKIKYICKIFISFHKHTQMNVKIDFLENHNIHQCYWLLSVLISLDRSFVTW